MSTSTIRPPVPQARTVAALCAVTFLLLGASACGSSDDPGSPAQGARQEGPQSGQDGPAFPGASGKVAAVMDDTAQVQGMDGQVAVTWTASTAFTKEVGAALSDVKVGSCVFVGSAGTSTGTTPATTVTAATVRITQPTNGSCGLVRQGPAGSGPQVSGTPPPGAPTGGARPQVRGIGGAVGEVTAVSATGFTVSSVMPGSDDKTTVTVKVDGGTSYTTTAAGAASDVKVGVCVQAQGAKDDTGAVTATTLAVSSPQDGQCGGMMRMRSSDGGTGS